MAKRGRATGMSLGAHVGELVRYIGRMPDAVLANKNPLPNNLLERYAHEAEYPVVLDHETLECPVVLEDFLATEEVVRSKGDVLKRSLIRHDPDKLAEAIMNLL